jgi:DNA-binding CsgD family transcriptional regulator
MIKKVFTLSPRELEIARLIAADEKPADMAAKLNISVKTVCTYRQRILEKLKRHGVRGNVGIALHLTSIEGGTP